MINYINYDMFYKNSIDKQIIIEYSGGVLTNSDIIGGGNGLVLTESICSGSELRFGGCQSNRLDLKLFGTQSSLQGETLKVSMVIEKDFEHPFLVGTYIVDSDTPSAKNDYRDVIAYDILYKVLNTDYTEWFNSIHFPISIKTFRDRFFTLLGVEQDSVTLVNDDVFIDPQIQVENITGKYILNALCEINAVFGHISRDDVFQYIELKPNKAALYPSTALYPSKSLFPVGENGSRIKTPNLIDGQYESYITAPIDKVVICDYGTNVEAVVGEGNNVYTIKDNPLIAGFSALEMEIIGEKFLDVAKNAIYRPCRMRVIGNPCLEVGDGFIIKCDDTVVRSYILERELHFDNFITDTYHANGTEEYSASSSNGLRSSVQRVEKSIHTIINNERQLSSRIEEVNTGLSSEISQTAEEISTKVSITDYNGNTIASKINQTATTIQIEASKINLNGYVTVSDLMGTNTTVIDGSNIKTGKIDASLLDISQSISYDGSPILYGNAVSLTLGNVLDFSTIIEGDDVTINGVAETYIQSNGEIVLDGSYVSISSDLTVDGELTVKGELGCSSIYDGSASKSISWRKVRDAYSDDDYVLCGD